MKNILLSILFISLLSGQVMATSTKTSSANQALGATNIPIFGGLTINGDLFMGSPSSTMEIDGNQLLMPNGFTLFLNQSSTASTDIHNTLILSSITGSTQCLHVDSSGNITGTGSDCGGGGSNTTLFNHYTDGTMTGITETDLYSDTISAGQLSANGDKITAEYSGIATATGVGFAIPYVNVYFGGTNITNNTQNIGQVTSANSPVNWKLNLTCQRDSGTSVRCEVDGLNLDSLNDSDSFVIYSTITGLTLSNSQIIKITGAPSGAIASTTTITAKQGYVQYVK